MVHPRLGADDGGDLLDPRRGDRQRGQRRGARRVRTAGRADAADPAAVLQAFQPFQHIRLGGSQDLGHRGEGAGDQRQVALELVQQAGIETVGRKLGHRPVLCARAVKKMPEGARASISPSFS